MFPGVKGGRCVGLQPYHLHLLIVLKSGSFNFLEPSGSVQACNGIALPLPLLVSLRGCIDPSAGVSPVSYRILLGMSNFKHVVAYGTLKQQDTNEEFMVKTSRKFTGCKT